MDKYIVIAGNIGAGKSTLVGKLCEKMSWKPYYEPVSENPYLEDFYTDMKGWAFHSQIFFLADRMEMHNKLFSDLRRGKTTVVQDRSIYEDAEIFARNLFIQKKMSPRDYNNYRKLYQISISLLNPPDLIVYLKTSVSTLLQRIHQRNREFERSIPRDYLESLNSLYHQWISSCTLSPVLTIDGDSLDIVNNQDNVQAIIEKIEEITESGQQALF